MNYPLNHYPPERPAEFNSREILDNIRSTAPHQRRRSSFWDAVQMLLAGIVLMVMFWYLYWPVARAFAWGVLWLCKATGQLDGDLPPYTPYPHDF